MKFFSRTEFQCGECGYVVWTRPMQVPGVMRIRCTNRGCTAHGKLFEVKVTAFEAEEVIEDGVRT